MKFVDRMYSYKGRQLKWVEMPPTKFPCLQCALKEDCKRDRCMICVDLEALDTKVKNWSRFVFREVENTV